MKAARIVAIVAVVIVVLAVGLVITARLSGFQHVHAMYRIAVGSAIIPCAQPGVARETFPAAHVHPPAYDIVHVEGRRAEGTLANFFRHALNGTIDDAHMSVHVGPGCDEDHVANATAAVVVLVEGRNGNWTEVPSPIAAYRFEDRTRVLVRFGEADPAALDALTSAFANATWDGP